MKKLFLSSEHCFCKKPVVKTPHNFSYPCYPYLSLVLEEMRNSHEKQSEGTMSKYINIMPNKVYFTSLTTSSQIIYFPGHLAFFILKKLICAVSILRERLP